ncbi:MAG: hypothetical protein U9Q67_04875 [Patescibacteria group bacterium]|nr:hypothetical protein [Patescibacteria group bacterium]
MKKRLPRILGLLVTLLAVVVILTPSIVSAFTDETDTFNVRGEVSEAATLSCATGSGANLDFSSVFSGIPAGAEERTATNTCTATTNSEDGYEIGIHYSGGEDGTLAHATSADEFAAHTGTAAAPSAMTAGDAEAKWGYRITDASECTDFVDWGSDGAPQYAGVVATLAEVSDDTAKTDQDGETCIFGFSAKRGSTKMLDDGYYDCSVIITMRDNTD